MSPFSTKSAERLETGAKSAGLAWKTSSTSFSASGIFRGGQIGVQQDPLAGGSDCSSGEEH